MGLITKNIGFANGEARNANGSARVGNNTWRLRDEAAGAMKAWDAAHRAEFGRPLPVNETMRDIATQQAYWDAYQNGTGNLAGWPGTSIHGWGLAADIDTDYRGGPHQQWLERTSRQFGWWPSGLTFSQVEPWHFEYDGDHIGDAQRVTYRMSGLGADTTNNDGGFLMALTDQEQRRVLATLDKLDYIFDKIVLPVLSRLDTWRAASTKSDAKK